MRRDAVIYSYFLIFRNRFILRRGLEPAEDIGAVCKFGFSARAKTADDGPGSAEIEPIGARDGQITSLLSAAPLWPLIAKIILGGNHEQAIVDGARGGGFGRVRAVCSRRPRR
jgi:hypothetical protein